MKKNTVTHVEFAKLVLWAQEGREGLGRVSGNGTDATHGANGTHARKGAGKEGGADA